MKNLKRETNVLILGLVLIGLFSYMSLFAWAQRKKAPVKKPPSPPATTAAAYNISAAFINVAQTVSASVVNLAVILPNKKGSGVGTGIIVDKKNGYVLTNAHVVQHMKSVITAVLVDERELAAKVLGMDKKSDLAVVEITDPPADLQEAILGDSNKSMVGEWVIAIGNPFGQKNTLTVGVVSALREFEEDEDPIMDVNSWIQTDATINPGNSGGPLINLKGKVIGINQHISGARDSRGIQAVGLGYAIPINRAKAIMEILIKDGKVLRPYLGIRTTEINDRLARAYGYSNKKLFLKSLELNEAKGPFVVRTENNSPAQKMGLREGDIIVELDNNKITKTKDINRTLGKIRENRDVVMKIIRGGKEQTLTFRPDLK